MQWGHEVFKTRKMERGRERKRKAQKGKRKETKKKKVEYAYQGLGGQGVEVALQFYKMEKYWSLVAQCEYT